MKFFILETVTSYAVVTIFTFFYTKTITTVYRIFRLKTAITSSQIHTKIDKLWLVAKSRIDGGFHISHKIWIQYFLAVGSSDREVTVFRCEGKICVIWIDTFYIVDWEFRCYREEVCILIKKSSLKIKSSTILCRIPTIPPPNCLIIDGIRFLRWINGDYFFPREITPSLVHFSFISPWEPPSLPLFRAKSRCWEFIDFPIKSRRYLMEYFYIFVSHEKLFPCEEAFFCFDDFFIRWDKGHSNKVNRLFSD